MSRQSSSVAPIERRAIFRRAFINSLPVMMGYVTMGVAAGVLLAVKGNVPCPPIWAALIAGACMSGTMSFAIVPALAASDSLASIALLALGINFRYAFYGFSLLGRWSDVPALRKWFMIRTLSDEVYALDVACRHADPGRYELYCSWNHFLCWAYWICGSVAGACAGAALPIPARGIEFAMLALFLVIFTDQIKDIANRHA